MDKLSKFGVFGTLDSLAGGDMTKYKAILLKANAEVMAKLMLEKEKKDYNKRLNKVLKKKAKEQARKNKPKRK